MRTVTSRQNPLVAAYRELHRTRLPGDDRVLLEGLHLVGDARAAELRITHAAFTSRVHASADLARLAADLEGSGTDVTEVSASVMAALSPVRSPSGVVAIAARPPSGLAALLEVAPALLLIAVDLQDPGNVGAIIRAAEAGRATGVALCGASADPWGWKALRAAMGSAFRLPVVSRLQIEPVIAAARARGLQIIGTVPRGGRNLFALQLIRPTAFVIGGEGPGLSPDVLDLVDSTATIPMRPPVESLNAAVSAALLVYEACRQRVPDAARQDG